MRGLTDRILAMLCYPIAMANALQSDFNDRSELELTLLLLQ